MAGVDGGVSLLAAQHGESEEFKDSQSDCETEMR